MIKGGNAHNGRDNQTLVSNKDLKIIEGHAMPEQSPWGKVY